MEQRKVAEYQAYARARCSAYGWSTADFNCLVALWNKESGWNPNAYNSRSGAYGIPQALPASKMATAGTDYRTNYKTQINWGLSYIKSRYGSPSAAWSAYGIPQALPASKMATAGTDYRTNYKTQINWGLSYIKSRYGSPSAAWSHSQSRGWY